MKVTKVISTPTNLNFFDSNSQADTDSLPMTQIYIELVKSSVSSHESHAS